MGKKPKQTLTEKFLTAWKEYSGCPDHEPEKEYYFHPTRRWRFDFAFPVNMVAVELEGGDGRHHTFKGQHDDCTKYNAATVLGWKVLRFTVKHFNEDAQSAIEQIMEALGAFSQMAPEGE